MDRRRTRRPARVTPAWVHPTALIEDGVRLGPGTRVWDNVHIRRDTRIGRSCIVGEKTHIAYDVVIGDLVKINAMVYICTGVKIMDGCMISAGTVFTNDLFPRATLDFKKLFTSEATEETLRTVVQKGATLGANATIGPGLTLGSFCMVGMGAVVTRDVAAYHLVHGNPARFRGVVCRCGRLLSHAAEFTALAAKARLRCPACGKRFEKAGGSIRPLPAR